MPCRDEAPLLRSLSETQSDQGLAVLGISFQEPELQKARDFIRAYALAYPSLIDLGARTAINYGVSGVPETFFIDRQGVVRSVDRGGLTTARLSEGLRRIGINWP
ncbi:TlpA disulfide reductase family protein [Deinococcus wulumuqiensis]